MKIEITGRDILILVVGIVLGVVLSGNVVITEVMVQAFFGALVLAIVAFVTGMMLHS